MYIICPMDDDESATNHFVEIDGIYYLFVNSGYSVGKVGIFRKVLNLLTIDNVYQRALKKADVGVSFEMVLYMTPPITLGNTISWIKKKYGAFSFLMLKDIFPQNAVDLGMIKSTGIMGFVYKYFRNKEKKLYEISDYIGCMSPANVKYILDHNPEVLSEKVGICVNCYKEEPMKHIDSTAVRQKYGIPLDQTIFLYGGNLGKPQGLDYFVRVLRENKDKSDRFFLICGGGNEQQKIEKFINEEKPNNVKFIHFVPADEFDTISLACDVGLIFLDNRFTIPNFPSRLLSIILNGKPVIAATDINTDIGEIISNGKFGFWCESATTEVFNGYLDYCCIHSEQIKVMGLIARAYFEKNYTQKNAVDQILAGYAQIRQRTAD